MQQLHTSDFDFELPPELIASHPLQQRDASRMLVVKGPDIMDKHIRDFVDYLRPGDVVVFNNSRVIPARFDATDSRGTMHEITLHTAENDKVWWGLCKKFNKIPIGEILTLDDGTRARVLDKKDDSGLKLEFNCENLFAVLDVVGKMPLPPYMKRDAETADRERYQQRPGNRDHLRDLYGYYYRQTITVKISRVKSRDIFGKKTVKLKLIHFVQICKKENENVNFCH